MRNGIPESLHRLPCHAPIAARLNEGDRSHDWDGKAQVLHQFFNGKESRLGIERIKNGFNDEEIHSPLDQSFGLLVIGLHQLGIGNVTSRRIVIVGGYRSGLGRGPDGPGHPCVGPRMAFHVGIGSLTCHSATRFSQLGSQRNHVIVSQGDGLSIEGVGFDNVGPSFEVGQMNVTNHLRASQIQQVVVALEILTPISKALSPEIGLLQLAHLDHGAHRTIQKDDAFLELGPEGLFLMLNASLNGGQ